MASRLGKTISALFILIMMLGMISCSKPQPVLPGTEADNPTNAPETEPDEKNDDITKIISNNSGSESVSRVIYYSINTKTMKLAQSVSFVKSGETLDPMVVLGLVEDSFEDSSIDVTFEDASFDADGYCIVEIGDSIKAISETNPDLETLILDACGQSILDNIDAPGVIIRLGEGAYSTEQYKFDINYVYMDM
ncbi:MAG: hypothetical protein K6F44_00755 [Lachnospiraceae bacterium]|nr:hypothetical protein [Lachnospiraceae bacterium]